MPIATQASGILQSAPAGGVPTAPTATSPQQPLPDTFGGLPALTWKGLQLPYERLRTHIRQELVTHKFIDRDGAHVESCGRHPVEIEARVPLLNRIQPGAQEKWISERLYPDTRNTLLQIALDKTSGTLLHPELGPLSCKLATMSWEITAQVRSGVWVDLRWIETDDTATELTQALSTAAPAALMTQAAADLDSLLANPPTPLVPTLPMPPGATFSSLAFAVRGAIDQTTLLQRKLGGQIDNLIYSAQAIQNSIRLLTPPIPALIPSPTSSAAPSPLLWPIVDACNRLKSACWDLKATLLAKSVRLGQYIVPKAMTLSQVSVSIPAPLLDLVTLNPAFMSSPVVFKDSVVRYYL